MTSRFSTFTDEIHATQIRSLDVAQRPGLIYGLPQNPIDWRDPRNGKKFLTIPSTMHQYMFSGSTMKCMYEGEHSLAIDKNASFKLPFIVLTLVGDCGGTVMIDVFIGCDDVLFFREKQFWSLTWRTDIRFSPPGI